MQYIPISRRLEIAFWTHLVSVIEKLQSPGRGPARWLLLFAFAGLCVFGAILMSASATDALQSVEQLPPSSASLAQAQAVPKQHNTLLILVEDLSATSPRLETVWLVAYSVELNQLTFLPLFPALNGGASQGQALVAYFALDAPGRPAAPFLQALSARHLWWDSYLVVDLETLAALLELGSGVDSPYGQVGSAQTVRLIQDFRQQPQLVLQLQADAIQALCRRTAGIIQVADPQSVLGVMASSSRSDLDWARLQSGWIELRQVGGALACEFPTLEK